MRHFGQHSHHLVGELERHCHEPAFSSRCLFGFRDSLAPALIWLAAGLFSLLAAAATPNAWLALLAGTLFFYWAWCAFWRAQRLLRVYPEGILLSASEFHFNGQAYQCLKNRCTTVLFDEITGIGLSGADLRIQRRDDLSPLVLIEGLSSKKRHQFHHLFDVQQRRGAVPATIAFHEPRVANLPEMLRIVFSSVVIFWFLHALAQ